MSLEFVKKPISIIDQIKDKVDKDGFIRLGDLPRNIFGGRQIKSIAAFLDGEGGLNPDINFGENIKFVGDSGNYSDMKIHIDSIE